MDATWLAQLPIPKVTAAQPVSGGDINQAYHLTTATEDYFLLVQPNHPQSFYDHEIDGLKLLGQVVNVPQVIASGAIGPDAYLVISYIDVGQGDQFQLGKMVGQLHRTYSPNQQFGYKTAFHSGDFLVRNDWSDNWADFFLQTRLIPLAQRLTQMGRFIPAWQPKFQRATALFKQLIADYDPKPSLLHGDLWAGNYLFDQAGTPYLIDPSVWYGDREFDIALTTVFGGYDQNFYAGYNQVYPLATGYAQRIEFYRLYYLMIHLFLFGNTYQGPVGRILTNLDN
ncbi:fructosamine kinase [Agrilactobacillus composti DSM 18527 = JCM 14202]|uniref:Fructosamine kinase n=1 Tax=Agrilactobacillus composti DSM 18527 = JCM 14202 TaxID=1423734 RepID=X0QNR7_9LACO|nr:fructosamine kinase family protein [Agrilactobacillus composti]KRM33203.1 fructosamine kinase [Agrilactobacillus composti DSM 18527 = JCM 14202]GAF40275.1 ribulosamine/erythrulosamine 3-kinase [Agrilactobacillus composti DSM 18527 = JCM 14202]